ncbi:MAG: glutathione S-transferase family protein [Gammaproteobacteria bacterium]|nr:glutathione S-transferase family protein [Gammaproteobacteria bacterium]
MITLHGFSYSNYYNIVKHVLLYKNIHFTEDTQYGSNDDYLAISPVGKIPALTTAEGVHLSESSVCCDYLEETCPEMPLYPADTTERARIRQVMRISELYLELPCRRLIPFVFTKTAPPDELGKDILGVVDRGVGALNRLCTFDPYIAGAELTMADIYLRYVMSVVDLIGGGALHRDIGADIKGLKEWQTLMAQSDVSKKVDADQAANREEFFAMIKARMNG